MPIRIPEDLPARDTLVREGVMVMGADTANRQDIRPIQIGLLNLMPNKIETETQFARLLGASPLQIELTLVRIGSHVSKTTPEEHLISFYQSWEEVKHRKFDGFIITGAPLGTVPYEDVDYWDEMKAIFEWTRTNVHSSFFVCWGANAALNHFHGLEKHVRETKAFGVYSHHNRAPASPYLMGFSDVVKICVSRWSEVRKAEFAANTPLKVLLESDDTGLCLLSEEEGNRLYILNHVEYESTVLKDEYERDVAKGISIHIPPDYFPDDDPSKTPLNRWRSHAFLLFGNWINQVYQTTHFDLDMIGMREESR